MRPNLCSNGPAQHDVRPMIATPLTSARPFSVVPASLALVITALLLLPFMLPRVALRSAIEASPFVLSFPPLPKASSSKEVTSVPSNSRHPSTSYRSARASRDLVPTTAALDPASSPDAPQPHQLVLGSPGYAPAADIPASSPLRLDSRVLREAGRTSKSEARRMAESAGTYFGDAPTSKQEKLATAVAKAGKPPCIAPGGSLLSIFVIAYKVAADECR